VNYWRSDCPGARCLHEWQQAQFLEDILRIEARRDIFDTAKKKFFWQTTRGDFTGSPNEADLAD
jgi:hypothetical protein